jgi:hypothetical protein
MSHELGHAAEDAFFAQDWLQWVGEAYGASGFGVAGTALVVLFAGALGLFNWTESFKVPAVWLALTTPLVAATLPAPIVWRLIGVLTTAVAMLFIGLFIYWRRL